MVNIFSVLSMGKSRLHETSMSAMLAYLINPSQDHGLGGKFLEHFLELANENKLYDDYIKGVRNQEVKFEIDLEVPYEHNGKRNDIDVQIKILDKSNTEIHRIIIENKIRSGAAIINQLSSYYEAVLKDTNNDPLPQTQPSPLSVIFITPDLNHKPLKEEFGQLESQQKTWIYWNRPDNDENSVVKIIQSILRAEQVAEISPINDHMRHTLKAFAYFINSTFEKASSHNRVGEEIGTEADRREITIGSKLYTIILRTSGQIQLIDESGEKVVARGLLRKFLQENKIEEGNCINTRCFGKQIFDFLQKTDS